MHMVRLTVEQVSSSWPLIKTAVEEAHPPTVRPSDIFFVNVLNSLLAGRMEAWVAFEKIPDTKISGVCITSVEEQKIDGTKTLLVFCVYLFRSFSLEAWKACVEHLSKYAKAKGCVSLSFYTANPQISEIAKETGFLTEYTYGVLNV